MNTKNRNPWAWVPSLYFAEGIPYVIAATSFALIMYKRMGISNADAALYTSWLYLPWVIKPFWSPFVDIIKTKRWWIVAMQLLIGAGLAGVAFCIPTTFFLQSTLAILWLIAFSSATHDIAADGFYMIALDENKQSLFVGIRSTFYRVAMIAGQGLLVILAGLMESSTGLEPVTIHVTTSTTKSSKVMEAKPGNELFFSYEKEIHLSTKEISTDSSVNLISFAKENNIVNGFCPKEVNRTKKEQKEDSSVWTEYVSDPLKNFLQETFNPKPKIEPSDFAHNTKVIAIKLSGKPEENIVLNFSQTEGDKSFSIVGNDRFTFSANNWDKAAYLTINVDPKAKIGKGATFTGTSGNIPFSWSITFFICAGLFIGFAVYHFFVLPKPENDRQVKEKNSISAFFSSFKLFFTKDNIGIAIAFILLYRLGEAQLTKLSAPFLLDSISAGGLGLSTAQIGFAYGTVGVIALTLGGILGGIVVAKDGFGKWLWPMILCMNVPNLLYVYMSFAQVDNYILICSMVGIEQFGYGFGFTAFMLYLIYISQGKYSTSHYAICTGFMALGMMLPGMIAGWIQECVGYLNFFIWVCICTIPGFILAKKLNMNPNFGKKEEKAKTESETAE